jgi:hypothetical protein
MRDRRQRAIRGTAVGAVAVLAAAVGHHAAGGELPGWLALAVGGAFSLPLGILLAARRPSLPRTAAIVLPSQAAFHYLFVFLGSPALPAAGGHHHGVAATTAATATATPMAGMDAAAHLTDPRMGAAHLLAALLTIALLRGAETAIAGMLVRRLVAAIALTAGIVLPAARPRPATPPAPVAPLAHRALSALPRRGPPVLSPA